MMTTRCMTFEDIIYYCTLHGKEENVKEFKYNKYWGL